MPKTKISEFSATPGNNTDIDGINIAEGCAPSGINDAIRELMSQLKDFQTGAAGDSFNGPVGSTTPAAGAFTTLTSNGATTLGDAVGDVITINGTVTYANANPTYSAGTANGVGYLNGSKQFTTGSALTFDGTEFKVNASSGNVLIQPSNVANSKLYMRHGSIANNNGFEVDSSSNTIFLQAGSEAMRLTSTGLGIGTSSPYSKLNLAWNSSTGINNGLFGTVNNSAGANNGYRIGLKTASDNANWAAIDQAFVNLGVDARTYITFSTTDNSNSFAERMRLDSSGNLGLGVTPSAWTLGKAIEVGYKGAALWGVGSNDVYLTSNMNYDGGFKYATTNVAAYYNLSGNIHKWYTAPSGTAGNAISFTQAMTLDASGNLLIGGTTSPAGKSNNFVNLGGSGGFWTKSGGTGYFGTLDNYAMILSTNDTERARIDSSGNLLVGTTNATPFFGTSEGSVINGSYIGSSRSGGPAIYVNRYTSTGTSVDFRYDGSTVGTISVTASATAYNTSSDYRLKDNQQPLTGSGAFIDALQPKTWNWKADGSKGVGFIAHEVQAVSPGSVVGEKDDVDEDGKPKYQAMEYGSAEFIANIVAELQSLRKRVAQLEGK